MPRRKCQGTKCPIADREIAAVEKEIAKARKRLHKALPGIVRKVSKKARANFELYIREGRPPGEAAATAIYRALRDGAAAWWR